MDDLNRRRAAGNPQYSEVEKVALAEFGRVFHLMNDFLAKDPFGTAGLGVSGWKSGGEVDCGNGEESRD